MMIQVDVSGRQHLAFGVVLGLDQLFRKLGAVVVINNGQCSHHGAILFHVLGDGVVPHQVANGLGAVLVTLLADGTIEPLQEVALERNSVRISLDMDSPSTPEADFKPATILTESGLPGGWMWSAEISQPWGNDAGEHSMIFLGWNQRWKCGVISIFTRA